MVDSASGAKPVLIESKEATGGRGHEASSTKTLSCPIPSLSASFRNPEMISTHPRGATFGQHLFPCHPDLEDSDLGFCCQVTLYL